MKKLVRPMAVALATSLLASSPAWAQRHGGAVVGPRGGGAVHYGGPYRSGTAVRGPSGAGAVHTQGPYRSGTAVRGPYGGGVATYRRPAWDAAHLSGYQRGFYGLPGWRTYGTRYGLVAPLAGIASLAFLSSGLLVGSYMADQSTVYVYVVEEGDQQVEYRVNESGVILSRRVVE